MKNLFNTFLLLFISQIGISQTWSVLPNAPVASWRHDDVFFLNADTGWVVNVNGNVYRTNDGGVEWDTLVENSVTAYRSVGFANSQTGWVGNLGPGNWASTTDTVPLYQTDDGGENWTPISNVSGILPTGICGINVVNDTVVYAVGRISGPAYVLKTTNQGDSWESIDMNGYCRSVIDCYFFHPDSGFVIGNTVSPDFLHSKALILYTTDGGLTWSKQFESSFAGTLSWKISFPSANVGYVSIESAGIDSAFVIKTTDKGLNWTEQIVVESDAWFQGVGFINDSVGWVGAAVSFSTINGGTQWDTSTFVMNFNRFRKVNDTLAYAVGKEVWKFTGSQITSVIDYPKRTRMENLKQNYPNPFSVKTVIPYVVSNSSYVELKVYDFPGRHIATIVDEFQPAGEYEVEFSIPYHEDAVFFYALTINGVTVTKSMVQVK